MFGGLPPSAPPRIESPQGVWNASNPYRETTRVVANNTLNTASARSLLSTRRSAGNAS